MLQQYDAASQYLVNLAKAKRSQDNISVIVIYLRSPAKIAAKGAIPSEFEYYKMSARDEDFGFLKEDSQDAVKSSMCAEPKNFIFQKSSNGQHENGAVEIDDEDDEDDEEDLGPETNVDAVDDVTESFDLNDSIVMNRQLFQQKLEQENGQDEELEKDENLDNNVPLPLDEKPCQNALNPESDNVADSEDSEDEWNYYRVDPNKDKISTASADEPAPVCHKIETQQGQTEPSCEENVDITARSEDEAKVETLPEPIKQNISVEQNLEGEQISEPKVEEKEGEGEEEIDYDKENMAFNWNPDAAEFVPESTSRPSFPERVNLNRDFPISGSPLKRTPKEVDDIPVPSEAEFNKEVSQRPRELDNEDSFGEIHTDNNEQDENLSKSITANIDESTEISSTKAEFGDESGMSFLTCNDFQRTGVSSTTDDSFNGSEHDDYDIAKDPMAMSLTPGDFKAAFGKEVDLNAVHELRDSDLMFDTMNNEVIKNTINKENHGEDNAIINDLESNVESPTKSNNLSESEKDVAVDECFSEKTFEVASPDVAKTVDDSWTFISDTKEEEDSALIPLEVNSIPVEKELDDINPQLSSSPQKENLDLSNSNFLYSSADVTQETIEISTLKSSFTDFTMHSESKEHEKEDNNKAHQLLEFTEDYTTNEAASFMESSSSEQFYNTLQQPLSPSQTKNVDMLTLLSQQCMDNINELHAQSPCDNIISFDSVPPEIDQVKDLSTKLSTQLNLHDTTAEFEEKEAQVLKEDAIVEQKDIEDVEDINDKKDVLPEINEEKREEVETGDLLLSANVETSKTDTPVEEKATDEQVVAPVIATAAATCKVASKVKIAAVSATKTAKTTKTAAPLSKTTTKVSPTSPTKTASSLRTSTTSAAPRKSATSSSSASRPKQLDTKQSTTSTAKTTNVSKSVPLSKTSMTTATKTTNSTRVSSLATKTKTVSSAVAKSSAIEKKQSITNGEAKTMNKLSTQLKTTMKSASTVASKSNTLVKPSTTKTASTRTTTATATKARPASATTKITSVGSVTSTVVASRPKTAPISSSSTMSSLKPRVSAQSKSPMIDKQIKETANKQISSARSTATTTKTTTRTSSGVTSTMAKRTSNSTTTATTKSSGIASSPTKKTLTAGKTVAKSTSVKSSTITKAKVVQNGVCETQKVETIVSTSEEDVPKKDVSPIAPPTDNQLIASTE